MTEKATDKTTERVRIYQLAKELGLESKDMLAILDDMGVDYKSHSSTLDGETAEAVRQLVSDNEAAGSATPVAAETAAPTVTAAKATPAAEVAPAAKEVPAATASPKNADATVEAELPLRAPVVTVMGHVDHGKTSLLDYIRDTKVTAREAGGITQHIGAYRVETPTGPVAFLDTPGHEAFTSIRQRGASATDIVVIVVAADDSIMPQTREAVAHAKAAGVPIIVAINKIDLPQSDAARVKTDLMQLELVAEEFGGDTVTVDISAKTGEGVDHLLEMISLVAEMENLRASPDGPAKGVVIESILDRQAGVLATVLVQEGTLRVGDYIVSDEVWARVRRLTDYAGKAVTEAGPSTPVQVLGFSSQPVAGDSVIGVADETTAKQLSSEQLEVRRAAQHTDIGRKNLTLADLFGQKKVATINLLLRADTQGALEAIRSVLEKESAETEEVELNIMLAEVGGPTESDLLLASTADATVMTFGVSTPASVQKSAERQGIPLKPYRIIYQLIEEVQRMIKGQIEPEFAEQIIGHATVRQVIHVPREGNIAGSYVTDGVIRRNARARVTRAGKEVYKGTISAVRRFKDDVREVTAGFECGINLQNYENMQEGDIIEAYEMVEVPV